MHHSKCLRDEKFRALKRKKILVSENVLKYNKCRFTAVVTPTKCNQCGVCLEGNSTLSSQSFPFTQTALACLERTRLGNGTCRGFSVFNSDKSSSRSNNRSPKIFDRESVLSENYLLSLYKKS